MARPLSSGGRRRVARYRMSTTSSGAPLLPAGFFGTAASDAADITSIGARTFAMPGCVKTGPVPALSPAAGESLNPELSTRDQKAIADTRTVFHGPWQNEPRSSRVVSTFNEQRSNKP